MWGLTATTPTSLGRLKRQLSGMPPEGHSWRSLAEMVTSFPTKICMVEHVSNSNITNYYRHKPFELAGANLGLENLGVEFRGHLRGSRGKNRSLIPHMSNLSSGALGTLRHAPHT